MTDSKHPDTAPGSPRAPQVAPWPEHINPMITLTGEGDARTRERYARAARALARYHVVRAYAALMCGLRNECLTEAESVRLVKHLTLHYEITSMWMSLLDAPIEDVNDLAVGVIDDLSNPQDFEADLLRWMQYLAIDPRTISPFAWDQD